MHAMIKRSVGLLLLVAAVASASLAAEPVVKLDLPYKAGDSLSAYEITRCKLDVYSPPGATKAPVLVWFYGGGLTGGEKYGAGTVAIARSLVKEGLVVVVPDYRLSPKATYPAYIQDAAAAVGWAHQHIAEFGGDPDRLFVGGHSAGGYLTLIVGMDPEYLKAVGVPTSAIAGLIPVSGQTMTHYTIREERGISRYMVTADDAAPVRWVRPELPPMLVLSADNDMPARAEENAFLVALLKAAGHKAVTGLCVAGRDHGTVADKLKDDGDPGRMALLEFVKRYAAAK
ncbi:MAG: alpha/beta hydrolase [Armatimonadetes bacterium]|nr:alpha/beta hydrolase [Armatimonadota bacterium]